jgi:peptidoglycan DL-endopeptidase CwlO
MAANAGRFGWVHPDWAQKTGQNPEPWHWEFGSIS